MHVVLYHWSQSIQASLLNQKHAGFAGQPIWSAQSDTVVMTSGCQRVAALMAAVQCTDIE